MSYRRLFLLLSCVIHITSLSISQTLNENNKKEQYLQISSGLMFSKSKVIDPKNFLETRYSESITIKATFEKQLRKRLYWGTSLSFNEYWIGYILNDNNFIFLGSSANAFVSLEGCYGLKYKVQTKKNKDILNLHLGLFIGYAFSSKGLVGNVGYFNYNDGPNIVNKLEGKKNQHSLLIIGNSIGISRDFKITSKLGVGLNFNYNIGYNKLQEIDIEYTTTSTSGINTAKSILSGTSWQLLINLRYKIGDYQ